MVLSTCTVYYCTCLISVTLLTDDDPHLKLNFSASMMMMMMMMMMQL